MAWIFERNLGAWCDAVAVLLGTALREAEWTAIRRGVMSSRTDGAFQFRLGERDGVEVSAMVDDPPDVVHVSATPSSHDGEIQTITMMCRLFTIQGSVRLFEGDAAPERPPDAGTA
jgi:hypothetical protein